jgi:ribosomal protein L21E
MGKKSSGNSYTSKGERPNVSKNTRKAMRRDYIENRKIERLNNQIAAWKAGKNVMLTVPNKGSDAKKMPFVRVNAREFWGNPNSSYMMKTTAE